MMQPRRNLDLSQKPLGPNGRGEFGAQHLHRHPTAVLQVFREVHGGHSSLAQLANDAVAVGEDGGEKVHCLVHALSRLKRVLISTEALWATVSGDSPCPQTQRGA